MIEIKHLNKYFGDLHVLKDVSLNVREGEKLVVIGPSGSGKSTLIRCVNWLEEPTSGEVIINGTPLMRKNHMQLTRTYTSMVFQQFNLYPNMTVLGNLTLAPIKLQKKTSTRRTSPAASSSAWPSHVRSAPSSPSCCSTSLPPPSIPRWSRRYST